MKNESEKVKNKCQIKRSYNSNHRKAVLFTLPTYILISQPTSQI